MKLNRLRVFAALGVLGLSAFLEFLLLNSREDRYHPGNMSGVWHILYVRGTEDALSWTVVVLAMAAFLFAPGWWKLGLGLVMAFAVLVIELADGRVLVSPQNSWAAGILFFLGVLYGIISVLSDMEVFRRLGQRLGFVTS